MGKVEVTNNTKTGGVGFCSLLTILFIGLKLTNKIDWSWVWVVSPLWLPLVVIIGITVVFLLGAVLYSLVTTNNKKK